MCGNGDGSAGVVGSGARQWVAVCGRRRPVCMTYTMCAATGSRNVSRGGGSSSGEAAGTRGAHGQSACRGAACAGAGGPLARVQVPWYVGSSLQCVSSRSD